MEIFFFLKNAITLEIYYIHFKVCDMYFLSVAHKCGMSARIYGKIEVR